MIAFYLGTNFISFFLLLARLENEFFLEAYADCKLTIFLLDFLTNSSGDKAKDKAYRSDGRNDAGVLFPKNSVLIEV